MSKKIKEKFLRSEVWDATCFQVAGLLKNVLFYRTDGIVRESIYCFIFEEDDEKEVKNFEIRKLVQGSEIPKGYLYLQSFKTDYKRPYHLYYKSWVIKDG